MAKKRKKRPYKLRTRAEAKRILREYIKAEKMFKKRVLEKHGINYSHIQYWRVRFKKEKDDQRDLYDM